MAVNTTVYCILVLNTFANTVSTIKITIAYKNKWIGCRNSVESQNNEMSCEHAHKILWPDKLLLSFLYSFSSLQSVLAQSGKFRSTVYKNKNLLFDFAEMGKQPHDFRSTRSLFSTQRISMKASLKSRKINYSVVLTWMLYHLSVEKHVERSTSSIFIFFVYCYGICIMLSMKLSSIFTCIKKKLACAHKL